MTNQIDQPKKFKVDFPFLTARGNASLQSSYFDHAHQIPTDILHPAIVMWLMRHDSDEIEFWDVSPPSNGVYKLISTSKNLADKNSAPLSTLIPKSYEIEGDRRVRSYLVDKKTLVTRHRAA